MRKKETPQQKFKKLPGITNEMNSHDLKNMAKGSKTVVKGSTTKLDTMLSMTKDRRFEPSSAQNFKGVKAMPNYNHIISSGQDNTDEEQQYFIRRQA